LNSIFCCHNVLRTASVTSDPSIAGFAVANALDGRTSTHAAYSAGTRTISFSFVSQTVGYLAIGKNNLGDAGATVNVYAGGVLRGSHTFTKNQVYVFPFADVAASTASFVISASTDFFICDFACGAKIEMPKLMQVGFEPPQLADDDEILANYTLTSELNGITVRKKPKKISIELKDFSYSWFDSNWQNFITYSKNFPFYFLFSPDDRPDDAFYCWHAKSIGSVKYSKRTYQSATLNLEGIS